MEWVQTFTGTPSGIRPSPLWLLNFQQRGDRGAQSAARQVDSLCALFAKVVVFILDSIVFCSDALSRNSPPALRRRFVNFINT